MDSLIYEMDPSGLESDNYDAQDNSSSIQDFLRQSSEIQSEIKQISRLCYQISPELGSLCQEPSKELGPNWAQVNLLLVSNGFKEVLLHQDAVPDLKSLFESLVDVLNEYAATKRELDIFDLKLKTQREQRKDAPNEYLNKIARQLSVNSYEEALNAIVKLQEVMRALPKVEHFMGLVYNEVATHTSSPHPNEVIAAIKDWRTQASQLSRITEALGGTQENCYERAKAIGHFCRLFEVQDAHIWDTVDQVYYFVLEIKNFLCFVRKNAGLHPECSVQRVLKELVRTLRSTQCS